MIKFLDVIRWYRSLDHQDKAIAYLQQNIPAPTMAKFAEIWRSQPQVKSINTSGLNLLKEFEGLRLNSYDDGVGVWTIGYGHTADVYPNQVINQQQAIAFLDQDLKYFETGILDLVKVPLTENQFSALVCFSFNVGLGAFGDSTMLKLLNDRDYKNAANEFSRWINGGGRILEGLVRRRSAERSLFLA